MCIICCPAVVNQKYEAEILTEYVIRGNSGILKCSIPSFVADFVQVESWISNDGVSYTMSEKNDYGIWLDDLCVCVSRV